MKITESKIDEIVNSVVKKHLNEWGNNYGGYLPDGADNDSRAPYNQDNEEIVYTDSDLDEAFVLANKRDLALRVSNEPYIDFNEFLKDNDYIKSGVEKFGDMFEKFLEYLYNTTTVDKDIFKRKIEKSLLEDNKIVHDMAKYLSSIFLEYIEYLKERLESGEFDAYLSRFEPYDEY